MPAVSSVAYHVLLHSAHTLYIRSVQSVCFVVSQFHGGVLRTVQEPQGGDKGNF